ncbi:hypothetical protein [Lewinella sp. W8]|uniref:hypothetical protein n=1 Tax=Lewinella sp. W8 TaxID=2528208 RepID=UPI0010677E97|nr:hypothetical protein [Lewinella sp. W8]MTB49781.1 hypothetical protein [Lewinella sp. W8]
MPKTYQEHRRRWMIKSGGGLAIIGFGACLIAEAAMLKSGGAATSSWVAYGTVALVVFNAGLAIFGDAVRHRVHMDRLE